MNEEQIKYVVSQLQAGVDRNTLTQVLKENGYADSLISELFAAADSRMDDRVTAVDTHFLAADSAEFTNGNYTTNNDLISFGDLMSQSFRFALSRADLVGWYVLVVIGALLLLFVPMFLLGVTSTFTGGMSAVEIILIVLMLPVFFCLFIMIAGILQYASIKNERVVFWDGFRYIKNNFWSWVWVNILLGAIAYGAILLPVIVVSLSGLMTVSIGAAAAFVGGILAFAVFLLLSVRLLVFASLHKAVFVEEGLRGLNAFVRSRQLVEGQFGGVLGRLLLVFLVALLTNSTLQILVGVLATLSPVFSIVGILLASLAGIMLWLFIMRATALIYHNLRSEAPAFNQNELKDYRIKFAVVAWLGAAIVPIAIFASVILASLNSLNSVQYKATDASTMATFSSFRASAELYYDDNNSSYLGLCEADQLSLPEGADCIDSAEAYRVSIKLENDEHFCADSLGFSEKVDLPPFGFNCAGLE